MIGTCGKEMMITADKTPRLRSRRAFDLVAESPYDRQVGACVVLAAQIFASAASALRIPARVAPSFNGRTADSGSAYRGSNPWGAANVFNNLQFFQLTESLW